MLSLHTKSRRKFLYHISLASFSLAAADALVACAAGSNEERMQKVRDHKKAGKLGIALVGLGNYSTGQLAPALQKTAHCYLAGIVTGTPEKADKWKKKYDIPDQNIYSYSSFDAIKDNPDIDIVYVVLPNALHAEYVIRAAQAGKHVICEKPMAVSVEECDRMIAACKDAGKKLSIGYRLHFEPHNLELMRLGEEKPFGNIRSIQAEDGMADADGWRLDKKLAGGGPLMDVGIYCVQACRYSSRMEPTAVLAKEIPKTNPEKFKSVEEALDFQLEFPNGTIAECKTSYTKDMNRLRVTYEKGWAELSPAYAYKGIKGQTSETALNLPEVVQQAKQMDDFARAVKDDRPSPVPGEMGRQDIKILEAIYRAAASGKKETI